jgi:hypothetical protein
VSLPATPGAFSVPYVSILLPLLYLINTFRYN